MTGLIVFACILVFFVFLLTLKATVTIMYSGEVELFVKVLCFKIKILPAKEKKRTQSMSAKKAAKIKAKLQAKEKKKKEKKKQKKKDKLEKKQALAEGTVKKEKKTPGDILDLISLVTNLLKKVIGKFFGHLRIKVARIRLVIGTGDAATTAITYGAVTQGINVIFPLLEGIKNFKLNRNADIDVAADFAAETTEIDICVSLSLRVWHLFHVVFAALGELIKYVFKSLKRKSEKKGNAPQNKANKANKTKKAKK